MNGKSIAVAIDLSVARTFMATHARLLDSHRFELLLGEGSAEAVLAALEPYRNPDGGYGHALEPDLRSTTSQTGAAMHAFEVFEDIAPLTSPRAAELGSGSVVRARGANPSERAAPGSGQALTPRSRHCRSRQ